MYENQLGELPACSQRNKFPFTSKLNGIFSSGYFFRERDRIQFSFKTKIKGKLIKGKI